MDKDLASVSENLHGSFVYQMGRGGSAPWKTRPSPITELLERIGKKKSQGLCPCRTWKRELAASAQGHAPFAHNDGPNWRKVGNEAHNGVGIAEDVVEFGAIARLLGVVVEGGSMYCCLWSWMIVSVGRTGADGGGDSVNLLSDMLELWDCSNWSRGVSLIVALNVAQLHVGYKININWCRGGKYLVDLEIEIMSIQGQHIWV
ncbi:hypothetical protein DFH09DRAFT_1095982 [Mycena vulgaris]|nr:hypothetical protein DFH09DRAFT_1095982 [Mycena vulgaris]